MKYYNTLRNPFFLIFLSLLIVLQSCSTNEYFEEENSALSQEVLSSELENSRQIYSRNVADKNLINSFVKLQETQLNSKNMGNVVFDNNSIFEVSLDKNSPSMIMANQLDFNENNGENYAIGATLTENGFSDPLIVKTSKISSNVHKIEYFNSNMQLISSIELNPRTKIVSSTNNFKVNPGLASKSCGQETADCLDDAYSNHGWVSVWAFVQTAFIPATGLALAAACAINECT